MESSESLSLSPLRSAGDALRSALRWWGSGLRQAVPEGVARWWSQSDRALVCVFEERGLRVMRAEAGKLAPVFEPASGDAGLAPTAPAAAIEKLGLSDLPLFAALPERKILRRTILVPAALQGELRAAAEFEIDRKTPFRADQVHFGARALGPAASGGAALRVEIAVAPRALVEEAIRRAEEAGLRLFGVSTAEEIAARGRHAINLMPVASVPSASSAPRMLRLALLAVAGGLVAAALLFPVWEKRAESIRLMKLVDESDRQANVALALRREAESAVTFHNALIARRAEVGLRSVILEELTRLLPDDTYVTQLDITGNRIELQGESGSAGKLVEVLEASQNFRNAAFRSPLVRVPGVNADRFQLTAEVRTAAAEPAASPPPGSPAPASSGDARK